MYAFDWSSIPGSLPFLWQGMLVTLQITLIAIVVGILLGTIIAVLRLSKNPILSALAAAYVTLFRSIPLVMVLLWFQLALVPPVVRWLFPKGNFDLNLLIAFTAFADASDHSFPRQFTRLCDWLGRFLWGSEEPRGLYW